MNFRVAYPVGNTARRDHGFWPTILRSELVALSGGDTPAVQRAIELEHPIGVDLDTMMVLNWRVREWKIEASTFSASQGAYDAPVASQDDIAKITYAGTTPAFSFRIQRYEPEPAPAISENVRDVTDEQDFLGEWRNKPLARDFHIDPPFNPIWKTCRNLGVSRGTSDGLIDFSNSAADPALIISAFTFEEPYNHSKFTPGNGEGGVLVFYMLTGYTIFDPLQELFYPPMFFSFGGAQLPYQGSGRPPPVFQLLPKVPIVTPDDPDILCGELTINFGATEVPSITIPIGRFAVFPEEAVPDGLIIPAATGDFDLTMNATKFWPFKTKGGDPVYDEDDGEEISDPFS